MTASVIPTAPTNGSIARRWRLWLFAIAVGVAVAFAGFSEDTFRYARSVLRQHDVQAHEVVVAIDDRTITSIGQLPFPRTVFADLVRKLFAGGAARVFFDGNFSTSQSARDDSALAAVMREHPGRILMSAPFVVDPTSGKRTVSMPTPMLARYARPVNTNIPYGNSGMVSRLPYALAIDGVRYEGMAAELAGVSGSADALFPIDTSISLRSIPTISLIDVLHGRAAPGLFAGRDVVIGATSETLQDIYLVPPYKRIGSVHVFAIGAETLRAGPPRDLGWIPAFLVAALIGAVTLAMARRRWALATLLFSVAGLLLVPLALPTSIFVSILPGLAVLLVIGGVDGQRQLRDTLRMRATTNQMSGLFNLAALRQIPSRSDHRLVVAHIHNFAEVISTLPFDAETVLVTQVAARLKLGMTGGDLYHGDNGVFAWFAPEDVALVGERLDGLHALFRSPVTAAGSNVDLAVTFGIDDGGERSVANRLGSALVAAAEAAAEGAKWREFDNAKLADAAWKLSLLSQLDAAIDDGHLWVAYQPKLDLATRTIIGAEALVRWTHPEKGAISPIEFVAAAEQHNRIERLTQHVLHRAVLAAATINAHDIEFSMAVNLSARLLETHDIVTMVADALAVHRLEPHRLTLEVTETAALVNGNSLAVLNELRALGLHISIDDYGTGLSTLEYLKKIPASEIKIDRSFVQAMMSSPSDLLMINSTIQLAHSLGHKVVAEGCETDEVIARLGELGCDIAQGFRIGRPMTFQDLARRILAERKHAA